MIVLILIAAFLVRLVFLNQSFWLDEATSAIVVRDLGFLDIITKFSPADFHPPLYYLTLKVWSSLFGTNEISIRFVSVLFGIGTIYLVYLIGKKLFNKQSGLVAALFLATSGLHIYYSQEARMYSMVTFFTALAFYFFTKVEEGSKRSWLLFSLSLPLIFLTDYLPITILSVFWVFAFFNRKNFSWWKSFILAHVPLLITVVFWLPYFLKQFTGGLSVQGSNWWNILGRTTLKEVLLIPAKFMIGRISIENKFLYPLLLGFLFLIFGFLIFKALCKNKKEERFIALWLFLPILISMLIGFFIPVLTYFRLLFVIPAFYILVAVGVSRLVNKWQTSVLALALLINIVSASAYLLNPKFHREDWRGLVGFVESQRDSNSQVLFVANSQMEGYNYYRKNVKIGGPESFDEKSKEIWLIRYVKDLFDPEDMLRQKVESKGFEKVGEYNFNGIPVLKYENSN